MMSNVYNNISEIFKAPFQCNSTHSSGSFRHLIFGELYTINMASNTVMGQNSTSQIPVKSQHGYSPKYAEHIFNVIGLNLPRHSLGHKLRQITNCDGKDSWYVAICDCRSLQRFKTQLLKLMSIVPEGILLSTQNTFTNTSDNFKKVSWLHRLWTL